MKKLLTIAVAAVLMFAAAGQAQAALETSGEFRARYWNLGNYLKDGATAEFWDQRLRLNLDWPIAEGVKLHARADILEGSWGDKLVVEKPTDTPDIYSYVSDSNTRPAISWDQVNLQFAVPNTPLTVTVGRQLAAWGPGLFVAADNRDRFKLTAGFGGVTALYTYDKYTEVGSLAHDKSDIDDRRQHSVGAIAKVAGWNTGLIYGIVQDDSSPTHSLTLHAIDGYAMGKLGPVDVKAELTVGFGEDDHDAPTADQDLEGLLAYLGLSMPAGPATLGLEGVFAQGNDPDTVDNEGALRSDYQSPFWSVILFNNMDYNGFDNQNDYSQDFGLTNAMAGKASASIAPMAGLSLYGAVVYAVRDQVGAGVDDQMGTEFDLVANYGIAQNVTLTVGGGYLIAGDYYGDIDDPWGAVVAFTTKF